MLLGNTSTGSLGTSTIDGSTNSSLVIPTSGSYPFYNYLLASASNLDPESPHTLEITASEGGAFYLDYIILQTTTAFVTIPNSNLAGTEPATPTTSGKSSGGKTSTIHGGIIAAIVVVVVLAIVIAGGVSLLLWRWRRSRQAKGVGADILGYDSEHPMMRGQEEGQLKG